MKELLKEALDSAFNLLEQRVPKVKHKKESLNVYTVYPIDIAQFIADNNIPINCLFNWDEGSLEWWAEVPTTEEDDLKFRKTRFTGLAGTAVYSALLKNGYTKKELLNIPLSRQFDSTNVYDMYLNDEWDKLMEYYSLFFRKPNEVA